MNGPTFTITHPVPRRIAASDGPGSVHPSSTRPHPAPPGQDLHRPTDRSPVHCSGRFRLQSLDNRPVRAPRSRTYQRHRIQENR
jgi:hypothetical protein